MDIPGDPALYTTQNGGYASVDLFFTNIKVADSSGNLATGWYLVTGDAESTDNYEDSIWSTCSAITDTKTDDGKTTPAVPAACTSSTDLTLLPDTYNGVNATAEIGNACTYTAANVPAATAFPGTWLTGVGTNTVECAASVSVDKSGTVMLEAPTPSTLTVQMNPQGLQAIFLGVLLP
jgi:hypothetical protein